MRRRLAVVLSVVPARRLGALGAAARSAAPCSRPRLAAARPGPGRARRSDAPLTRFGRGHLGRRLRGRARARRCGPRAPGTVVFAGVGRGRPATSWSATRAACAPRTRSSPSIARPHRASRCARGAVVGTTRRPGRAPRRPASCTSACGSATRSSTRCSCSRAADLADPGPPRAASADAAARAARASARAAALTAGPAPAPSRRRPGPTARSRSATGRPRAEAAGADAARMSRSGGRYTGLASGPIRGHSLNHSHARDPKVVPTVFNRSVLARAVDPT